MAARLLPRSRICYYRSGEAIQRNHLGRENGRPCQVKRNSDWGRIAFGFSGSILDLLVHVTIDSLMMPDQAFGERTLTAEAVWERFQAQGGNLAAALELLEEGYQATHKTLAQLTDRDLEQKVGAQQRSAESLFIELIEHYLYHAGQVNYIRYLWEGAGIAPEGGIQD